MGVVGDEEGGVAPGRKREGLADDAVLVRATCPVGRVAVEGPDRLARVRVEDPAVIVPLVATGLTDSVDLDLRRLGEVEPLLFVRLVAEPGQAHERGIVKRFVGSRERVAVAGPPLSTHDESEVSERLVLDERAAVSVTVPRTGPVENGRERSTEDLDKALFVIVIVVPGVVRAGVGGVVSFVGPGREPNRTVERVDAAPLVRVGVAEGPHDLARACVENPRLAGPVRRVLPAVVSIPRVPPVPPVAVQLFRADGLDRDGLRCIECE